MQLYRVTWVNPAGYEKLSPSQPGHPLFSPIERQGAGRFDLPEYYRALYFAQQAAGAVGETMGNFTTWRTSEIRRSSSDPDGNPLLRCLVTVETDRMFIDLDNASTLVDLGWRPSDVVGRDREKTQELAHQAWETRSMHGGGGFRWWSYYRPAWTVCMAWAEVGAPGYEDFTIANVEPLEADLPCVKVAVRALGREFVDDTSL